MCGLVADEPHNLCVIKMPDSQQHQFRCRHKPHLCRPTTTTTTQNGASSLTTFRILGGVKVKNMTTKCPVEEFCEYSRVFYFQILHSCTGSAVASRLSAATAHSDEAADIQQSIAALSGIRRANRHPSVHIQRLLSYFPPAISAEVLQRIKRGKPIGLPLHLALLFFLSRWLNRIGIYALNFAPNSRSAAFTIFLWTLATSSSLSVLSSVW